MAEITEFVPIAAVDPVYFDKAYYLAPDKLGAKACAFAGALRETKRCALGRWAARGKQYIVMIRPVEDGLVMQQLLYAGEVRSMKDIEIRSRGQGGRAQARENADRATGSDTFDPSVYTDEVSASRLRCEKVEGQEITLAEAPEGEARRSSISWKRCARASRRRRLPLPRDEGNPPRRASHRSARKRHPPRRRRRASASRARVSHAQQRFDGGIRRR
jgi:DNA end-binding protein Ku